MMMKKIIFRCDSSSEIGLGHIIRCLAVARTVSDGKVIFATQKDKTNSFIDESFDVFFRKENENEEDFLLKLVNILQPDVLVMDKKYDYKLDTLKKIHEETRIVMIDNICEGLGVCDEIIFPNAHLDNKLLKDYLSPEAISKVKTGLEYVIIRDEIRELKNKRENSLHKLPVVLVTTGGSDPEGILLKILPWLNNSNINAQFRILIGKSFKFKEKIYEISKLQKNISILNFSSKELLNADIAICTFGITIYELIYLSIPTICISHNPENAQAARNLSKKWGVIEDLVYFNDVDSNNLNKAIIKLLDNKTHNDYIERFKNLIDDCGAKRVGNVIMGG